MWVRVRGQNFFNASFGVPPTTFTSVLTVTITGADGLIQYVNPAFERITGYTRAEVLGRNPRLLQSGQQERALYRAMWQTLMDGESWHGEFVDKRKDGGVYDAETTNSPIRDAAENTIGYVGVQRDVSDRKRAEPAARVAEGKGAALSWRDPPSATHGPHVGDTVPLEQTGIRLSASEQKALGRLLGSRTGS